MPKRPDDRKPDQIRECRFQPNYLRNATGSVMIEQGHTRIICAVSCVPGVPRWMKEQGVPGGWLTSEYQMLPAATGQRTTRDLVRGRINGRSQEIQRLIGRSLRAVVDLHKIGDNTIYVDCDVIDADGGTRCASINGASVALQLAFRHMLKESIIYESPMQEQLAAVSVGVVRGDVLLDLCYSEDSEAQVDMNIVMTENDRFVEIQGTAEEETFSRDELDRMLTVARKGIGEIISCQKSALKW